MCAVSVAAGLVVGLHMVGRYYVSRVSTMT